MRFRQINCILTLIILCRKYSQANEVSIYCFQCDECITKDADIIQCAGYCYLAMTIRNGTTHGNANAFAKRFCGPTNMTLTQKCYDQQNYQFKTRDCHCDTNYCNNDFLGISSSSSTPGQSLINMVTVAHLMFLFNMFMR